jgi:hypothetical protein
MPENLTVGPLYTRKIDQVMVEKSLQVVDPTSGRDHVMAELTLDLGPGLRLIFAQAIYR